MSLISRTVILFLLISGFITAQVSPQVQRYRDDQKGTMEAFRSGQLGSNNINTIFDNAGNIGRWPFSPSGEWPSGSGHNYLDGTCLLIASEVTAPGNKQIIHPLITYYREWVDHDPVNGDPWTLMPVPGYYSASSFTPAVSTNPDTWPAEWPAALGLDSDWNGCWYGYFGKNVINADMETFFVMDDSQDREFMRAPYNFYPIASDSQRAGLGLRIEGRAFQWSYESLNDALFFHYDVINISDNDYPKTCFGFYFDSGVGGSNDSGDDCAAYDTKEDMIYAFDLDGMGTGFPTGYIGFAYLESPGNSFDSIDNDQDGLIDESRNDGIDNDNDWNPATDDTGMDGVAGTGDSGESDGIPTMGEPNFDFRDKDESDQIGLTAVSVYRLGDGGVGGGWPKDDETMWDKMTPGKFETTLQNSNISIVLSSGQFMLSQGGRERYSLALIFGDNLEDLTYTKKGIQSFYNNDYILTQTKVDEDKNNHLSYCLSQNYPNPFNPSTAVKFSISAGEHVSIRVYDVLGNECALLLDENKPAGEYEIYFDASGLSSGVYYYSMRAGDYVDVKKLMVLK